MINLFGNLQVNCLSEKLIKLEERSSGYLDVTPLMQINQIPKV